MVLSKLRNWLRNSHHIHAREANVNCLSDLIVLIDRFLDDELRYGWEWDDFVSWDNPNPNIEEIRGCIARTEPLFLSKDPASIAQGTEILLNERNLAALSIGQEVRIYGNAGAV